ncbi:hypothetical protein Rin_00017060 [Candidatus Regiella insecticola 5.15]|uniref:Uncharacterized protein n=1 Tax=Candidatus Regiella insecticola 5.15 TaxID=1005043 RepID=G2H0X2_9ENTR|nr:hypothetical protein [Candidatus Regiella insecticola]EGY28365.1 hypothetical protein Rin_00017060 [Candidatus Regiella insecticola 5.15]
MNMTDPVSFAPNPSVIVSSFPVKDPSKDSSLKHEFIGGSNPPKKFESPVILSKASTVSESSWINQLTQLIPSDIVKQETFFINNHNIGFFLFAYLSPRLNPAGSFIITYVLSLTLTYVGRVINTENIETIAVNKFGSGSAPKKTSSRTEL